MGSETKTKRLRNTRKPTTARGDQDTIKLDSLARAEKQAIETFKHAKNTRDSYKSAIACARSWLRVTCQESPDDQTIQDNPDFVAAFDGSPKACSGKALAMYITFKCFEKQFSKSTGTTVHAALKKYWSELCVITNFPLTCLISSLCRDGDLYRGEFRFCERRGQWVGNPADTAEVKDLLKALQNKAAANGGERAHSVAITYELLEKMMNWSNDVCPYDPNTAAAFSSLSPAERHIQTQHICFRAFTSLTWTLWARQVIVF
jgi:hypothetical protein